MRAGAQSPTLVLPPQHHWQGFSSCHPSCSAHTERAQAAKGWCETAAHRERQKCLCYVKQFEKQHYKLTSKSVTQLNCFAVCFDIEWILAVHMRTAFHEQHFDTCSMVWVSFSGCHVGLSPVCNLGDKHLQGTHGNLLWLAGRDGNAYEGGPLKQLRTTKTTTIAVKFELILLQNKIRNHFKWQNLKFLFISSQNWGNILLLCPVS